MQTILQLQVNPQTALNEVLLKEEARRELALKEDDLLVIKILKRSIDARGRNIKINLTLLAFVNEPLFSEKITVNYLNVFKSKKICHIIGAGPAGLFAALRCLELGIKPVVIERGKDVKARRRDLAAINKKHVVNPESN
jgi:uncharacterized FAD-dependent dehydrogenase